jgi:hypothetical protein
MKLSKRTELSNTVITNEKLRYAEIYKITCLTSKKSYVGQAVSHILNHNKYRPYGMNGRFRCHISEAYSNKKCQSKYLNNAIKKYGQQDFKIELLTICELCDANTNEILLIERENTLFPNGYNLTKGGQQHLHTNESKKRVSLGVERFYKEKKFTKFMKLKNEDIVIDKIESYIRPLNRNGNHYGYYVYINRLKTDFGGVHIDLNDSYENAKQFIVELKHRLAKHLDAGNSLESQTTTPTSETKMEELG